MVEKTGNEILDRGCLNKNDKIHAVLCTIFKCLTEGGKIEEKDEEILRNQAKNPFLMAIIAGSLSDFLLLSRDMPGDYQKIYPILEEVTGLVIDQSHINSSLIYLNDDGSLKNLL